MLDFGYDSAERVAKLMRELVEAAERSMISPTALEQQLTDKLRREYDRQVAGGNLAKRHSEIPRFTLERIRPQLRAELDRRIVASANLIKLNRAAAIEKTMQRFSGWATSIPIGGMRDAKRQKAKDNIRKSLSSLPFEERRVIIDQGHKLIASINEITAKDGGAIALRWRSNWRQPGYAYRKDHKERDGVVYLIRDSWAHKAGLVKKGGGKFYDEIDGVGQAIFCRCYAVYLYGLDSLPFDMLTQKGKEAIASQKVTMRTDARADAEEIDVSEEASAALTRARQLDELHYLRGLTSFRSIPDRTKWHAAYDPDRDEVETEAKFEQLGFDAQVQVLMHEAGHRGQEVDAPTYEAFKAAHFNQLSLFLAMANPVHLRDFEKKRHVDGLASEIFAESYSRFVLGMEMPEVLRAFWTMRFAAKHRLATKAEAVYIDSWPNKPTRCIRCTMFVIGQEISQSRCTAVEGEISPHGHCKFFEIL